MALWCARAGFICGMICCCDNSGKCSYCGDCRLVVQCAHGRHRSRVNVPLDPALDCAVLPSETSAVWTFYFAFYLHGQSGHCLSVPPSAREHFPALSSWSTVHMSPPPYISARASPSPHFSIPFPPYEPQAGLDTHLCPPCASRETHQVCLARHGP